MQFQVPQFIEVEDKIVGPFTLKQFVYVAGGAGLSFVLWKELPFLISLPLIGASLGISVMLAFMQYNNQPFILAVEHAFYFLIRGKLYLWNTDKKKKPKKAVEAALAKEPVRIPTLSDSKLHELAWSLDIKEKVEEAVRNREAQNVPQTRVSRALGINTARGARI